MSKCPECNSPTHVIDSRPNEDRSVIRRRRVCDSCAHRFSTYECYQTLFATVHDERVADLKLELLDAANALIEATASGPSASSLKLRPAK